MTMSGLGTRALWDAYTGAPAGEAGGDMMKGKGVRAAGGLRRCRRGDDDERGDIVAGWQLAAGRSGTVALLERCTRRRRCIDDPQRAC